jgi:hypothetical protein
MADTDATCPSATLCRGIPAFDRWAARITRPGEDMVQRTIRTVSPAGEPASSPVPHTGAARGFVFGIAAGRLSEMT